VRRADPPRVLVLGDRGVGGSAVIQALRVLAAEEGMELPIERGLRRRPSTGVYSELALALIVWEASLQRSLSDYAAHHSEQLRLCVGRHVPAIVVCNKTDTMPCPLPQVRSKLRHLRSRLRHRIGHCPYSRRGSGACAVPPRFKSTRCPPRLTSCVHRPCVSDRGPWRFVPFHRGER
jgi:hypothetical protein